MHPAKIQISLRIHAVWLESSLGAFWIAKDTMLLHADNEDDTDQIGAYGRAHMSEGTFPPDGSIL